MKINDIRIESRFRKDLGDIQTLAISIQDIGLLQPPVINENNELIAGQRRIEACKLLGWTEIPATIVNLDDIIRGEFHENAVRKDFTASERVAILEYIEARRIGHRIANSSNGNGKGANLAPFQNNHKGEKSRDIAARYTGVKRGQLQMERKVVEAARKDPNSWGQLIDKVDNGTVKLHKAYYRILREERKLNGLNAKPVMKLPDNVKLIQGDCRDRELVSKLILDNSIPLIFTDLPYDEKSLPLYGDLAVIADRVLMPGGALVTYASHPWLPRIFKHFEKNSPNLIYRHEIALIHAVVDGGRQKAREWSSHTEVGWKPLLLYVKGEKLRTVDFIPDIIFSNKPDKELHEWQQSPIEARKVIRWLTFNSPNEIVLDPFMGSGTTGIAARKLGRSFIGIDIDPENVRTAKTNIANFASFVEGDEDE